MIDSLQCPSSIYGDVIAVAVMFSSCVQRHPYRHRIPEVFTAQLCTLQTGPSEVLTSAEIERHVRVSGRL